MKTKEELNELKKEIEALNEQICELTSEELEQVIGGTTMLQGKAAGVQVTSCGQPGADPSVRIRGIGSFESSTPLYVIG